MDAAEQQLLADLGRLRDRETIKALAPAVVGGALFEDAYSPALVRFWLVPSHYAALLVLAEGSSSSAEGDYLAHEWQLVQQGERETLRRTGRLLGDNPPGCLCDHLYRLEQRQLGSAYPQTTRTRGGRGDAAGRSQRIVADLEYGVDRLPLAWPETRRLYAIQQRSRAYYRRYQAWRLSGQPAHPEPGNARWQAMVLVARALGWQQWRAA